MVIIVLCKGIRFVKSERDNELEVASHCILRIIDMGKTNGRKDLSCAAFHCSVSESAKVFFT